MLPSMPARAGRAILFGIFLTACGGDGVTPPGTEPGPDPDPGPEPTAPALIVAGSDTMMSGAVRRTLKDPLVVRVVDADGHRLPGETVRWVVSAGGGTVSDTLTTTDSQGEARTLWTLPDSPGSHKVRASLGIQASLAGPASVGNGADLVVQANTDPSQDFTAQTFPDTIPPAFVTWSFAPEVVDVDEGPATVEVAVTAADSGSSVAWVLVRFDSPGGGQRLSCSEHQTEGVVPDEVTWTCEGTIPAFAEAGDWEVVEIVIQDRIGHETRVSAAALREAELPAVLSVISSSADVEPPLVMQLAFEPEVVDVSDADGVIAFEAVLADAASGVATAQLAIVAPGGTPWADCLEMTRAEGDASEGTWTCDITIPASTAPATWTVARLSVWDHAGNSKNYLEPELRDAGHPVDITVVSSTGESDPPALTGLVITPNTVDVSEGSQPVTFAMHVADEGSGVLHAQIYVEVPGTSGGSGCLANEPTEGTRQEGIFSCFITIPGEAVEGDRPVLLVSLQDVSGNAREYDTAQLEAEGFPTTITVTR